MGRLIGFGLLGLFFLVVVSVFVNRPTDPSGGGTGAVATIEPRGRSLYIPARDRELAMRVNGRHYRTIWPAEGEPHGAVEINYISFAKPAADPSANTACLAAALGQARLRPALAA